jgi:transcriptional regulator with XRE-family HTH domain
MGLDVSLLTVEDFRIEMSTSTKEKQAWAKRISDLMDAQALTIDDLAKRLRLNRSAVDHWRKGRRIPSRATQAKLAKELGTSIAALNGWAA